MRNIAVVGCGYWGRNLVRNFAALGALHTICDSDRQRLAELRSLYPDVNAEANYERVLENESITGIVIATPAAAHYAMAKKALLAGKDIFVEKPLTLNSAEAQELVELSAKQQQVLLVGHLLIYHPAVQMLKHFIQSGELGKIYYLYATRVNLGQVRRDESALWRLAPHDIALFLYLLGDLPEAIATQGSSYLQPGLEDVVFITLRFPKDVLAQIHVSWLDPHKIRQLTVVGDKKMVIFDDMEPSEKLKVYDKGAEINSSAASPSEAIVLRSGEVHVPELEAVEPLSLECRQFVDCIQTRDRPLSDGKQGLEVVRILETIQRSLEDNGKVIFFANREKGFFVHETSIVEEPCEIGEGTKVWHFSHLMPNITMGQGCVVGQNVFIGKGVKIGNNVKIENNVSVFEGVTLEDNVFCGPSCVFTNVINPRSHISRKHEFRPTLVGKGATIGANATIICGNSIGRYAFIGASAVVTQDVPDYALVYGNPARLRGWVCECGTRLDLAESERSSCSNCGETYIKAKIGDQEKVEKSK